MFIAIFSNMLSWPHQELIESSDIPNNVWESNTDEEEHNLGLAVCNPLHFRCLTTSSVTYSKQSLLTYVLTQFL